MRVPFPIPVWKVSPQSPEEEVISQAALIVQRGGIVVYPTETFYGLGGHPVSDVAVEKIFLIKGRSPDKPLPLIAADMEVVLELVADWPPEAQRLAELFWPGPLMLVLRTKPVLSPRTHAHTGKIAVRISSQPVATALSAAVGGILISTSANFANQPPGRDPQQLPNEFISKVDGVLDGGPLTGDLPSTIIDVSVFPARLLRSGCISIEKIKSLIDFDLLAPL